MSRAYLKASLPITVLFSAIIFFVTFAGSQRPRPPALNGFDDCHLPCWHGIIPEQTATDASSVLLADLGYEIQLNNPHWRYMTFTPSVEVACNVTLTYERLVLTIELSECTSLTLGDVTAILGAPQGVVPSVPYDSFTFRDGMIEVVARRQGCKASFSLHAEITSIRLRAIRTRNTPDNLSAYAHRWRGFLPLWRYTHLQSGTINC